MRRRSSDRPPPPHATPLWRQDMSKQDNVIKLLLIEDSVEDAEQMISVLRNGSIAVRPASGQRGGAGRTARQPDPTHRCWSTSRPSRSRWPRSPGRQSNRQDIAVVANGASVTEDQIVSAFRSGARIWPCARATGTCRWWSSASSRRWPCAAACGAWSGSARDRAPLRRLRSIPRAIDRLRARGMHVRADKAYRRMFGFSFGEVGHVHPRHDRCR